MAGAAVPSFTASVTRADDLLALSFDFYNLQPDTAGAQPSRVVRVVRADPAFVAVRLPPQHVAEQVQDVAATPRAVLANPSRLVFRLADDTESIGFTLPDLLDWARHAPSLPANAVAGPPPDLVPLVPAEPGPTETAIELPYRLVLCPDESSGWNHATDAVTHDGVSELWQTRLGVRQEVGVDDTQVPGLRAVWARDLQPGDPGLGLSPDPGLVGSPLDAGTRAAIVGLSSFFGQEILLRNPVRDPLYYTPPPLRGTHLVLSTLGGWTDLRGDWDFPEDPDQVYPNQRVDGLGEPRYSLLAWRHVVAQGRDQYVRVVQRGSLYPLGHRAARVEVFERRLGAGGVAELRTEVLVVVREAARNYEPFSGEHPNDHALPLRSMRIETLVTPPQNPITPVDTAFVVSGVDGASLRFQVTGLDWSGRRVDLQMPLVFVPAGDGDDPGPVYESDSMVDVRGQHVALAPGDAAATSLPVQTFTFAADRTTTFLPYVAKAGVSIPAIDHLVGSVAPNTAAKSVVLVDPATSAGAVFARLEDSLAVDLPPQRAGGLARPSIAVGALSRSLGAVPAGLDDLATVKSRLFADLAAARLLGSISLADVIGNITSLDQLPRVRRQETPTGTDITFLWSPPLQNTGPLLLRPGAELTLATTLHIPAGNDPPRSSVRGVLTNFAVNFLDVVEVSFDSIEFTAEQGKQMTVRPTGVRLRLQRELEFFNVLADLLPSNGLSDGPSIAVSRRGVTAGYSLGLPAAGIGIFSLENVELSAAVVLPFDGTPAAVRLSFSERAHPFLATVSMIGGAGFFALEVDTEGVKRIEGAIEVGANMTVNLAIVSANVHVMAGFYFGLTQVAGRQQIDFSAYLRIGGSVELLGIAGVSVDITLSMALELTDGRPVSIGGRASVVVSVHLLMFTKSVSLSTEKHFAIAPHDPSFEELVTEEDWETYCGAFA